MRRKSPVTVQQWIDSLPVVSKTIINTMNRNDTATSSTLPTNSNSPVRQNLRGILFRDSSIQSDDASNCSSVESVLELRKPDPEQVLIELGFGPPKSTDYLSRIPQRFLQPSKLNGIDVCKFIEEQTVLRMMEENYIHQYIATQSQSFNTPLVQNCDIKENENISTGNKSSN